MAPEVLPAYRIRVLSASMIVCLPGVWSGRREMRSYCACVMVDLVARRLVA